MLATAPLARTRPAASLAAYVLFVAIVTAAYAVVSARAAQSWIMGEWLINYQGGFVRRGLPGELILRAARALDRPPIAVALVLAILLYAVFYASALLLTRGVRWSLPLAMLFLSPATLGFIVLDPPSSVRKEVLLLAAVGLLCLALHRGRVRPVPLALCLALTAAVCVLSHEGLVFFLPYLFAPVFLERASPPRDDVSLNPPTLRAAIAICLPALTVGVSAAIVVARHPGGPAAATASATHSGQTSTERGTASAVERSSISRMIATTPARMCCAPPAPTTMACSTALPAASRSCRPCSSSHSSPASAPPSCASCSSPRRSPSPARSCSSAWLATGAGGSPSTSPACSSCCSSYTVPHRLSPGSAHDLHHAPAPHGPRSPVSFCSTAPAGTCPGLATTMRAGDTLVWCVIFRAIGRLLILRAPLLHERRRHRA